MSIIKIIFIIVVVFIFILLLWRLLSRYYVLPCPAWLGWLVELDNPFCTVNRSANIIKYAEIKEGMSVLDIGCGPGRVTIPAAHIVGPHGNVVAMDIQEKMLRKTEEKARTAQLTNITYLHGALGIKEKKLTPNTFDRILLVTVLGEIPNQAGALKEIFDTLKPGGILSITETLFDPHYQRHNTIRRIASEIGFKEKNVIESWCGFTMNVEKPLT